MSEVALYNTIFAINLVMAYRLFASKPEHMSLCYLDFVG